MKAKKIPRYLHTPYQVLWFEPDDMAITTIFFMLAMIFGGLFWLALFAGPYTYTKFKKKYPRGFLKHLLYFTGITSYKNYPTFYEKEFRE